MTIDDLRALPAANDRSIFSGVYFIWGLEGLDYVGQSRNIARRLAYHKAEYAGRAATCLRIPEPWQLAFEQLYIDAYAPPGNKHSPGLMNSR